MGFSNVCHYALFTFLQAHLFPSMWAHGHHFHTKDVDDGHMSQGCGVEVEFDRSSHFSHHDENLIEGNTLGYIGNIQEIMQVDFSFFNVLFSSVSGGIPLTRIM